MDIKQQLALKHKNYSFECEKQRFLLESYLCGFAYKNDKNLHKYINELPERFNNRLKRAFPINFLSPLVDEIKNTIFSKEIVRDGEKNDYLARFIKSATLDNKTLTEFMKQVATLGSFLKIGVLIEGIDKSRLDKLEIKSSVLDKEVKEKYRLFPNAKIFLPSQILNYSMGSDKLNWILLDYSYYDDEDFENPKEVKKYVLYTKDYWKSFTFGVQNEVTEFTFEHKLGEIPFLFFFQKDIDGNSVSESIYDDIAFQQNNIFNYYSLIDESLYSSIFTYLMIQEPDFDGIVDNELRKQLKEKPFEFKNNILSYAPKSNPPSLLKTDFANVPVVLQLIDKITKEIYRKVGKFLDNNNFWSQSGTAKEIDNEQRNQNIINYSMQLQDLENKMLRLFYKYETKENMPENFESIYPSIFDMVNINEKIDNAIKLKNIFTDKSQKAVNLLLINLFKDLMRNKVTEKEISEVSEEINTENSYNPLLIDIEDEVKEGA